MKKLILSLFDFMCVSSYEENTTPLRKVETTCGHHGFIVIVCVLAIAGWDATAVVTITAVAVHEYNMHCNPVKA